MAKSEQIRVVLVRSGRTPWDDAGRIGGSSDLPLSPKGRATVLTEAGALTGAQVSVVVCSPDEASLESARILAKSVAGPDGDEPRVRPVEELGNVCLGLWEGRTSSELEEKCPRTYRQWREAPTAVVVPEGETLEEAQDRITKALTRFLERADGDGCVAIVLRPLAMALVRCWLDARDLDGVWSIVEDQEPTQWRTIPRELLRKRAERTRAGA